MEGLTACGTARTNGVVLASRMESWLLDLDTCLSAGKAGRRRQVWQLAIRWVSLVCRVLSSIRHLKKRDPGGRGEVMGTHQIGCKPKERQGNANQALQ